MIRWPRDWIGEDCSLNLPPYLILIYRIIFLYGYGILVGACTVTKGAIRQ